MKSTLKSFHFDPEKSGRILKGWAKSAGLSYQRVADETNYSYDTINNSLSGKIKELSLERVFKISTCCGHSVCEYLRLMLIDEDIDFADRIHVLREADYNLVPYTDTLPAPVQNPVQPSAQASTPDTVRQIAREDYATMMDKARDVNQANLDRFKTMYDSHLKMLSDSHIETVQKMEERHQEYVKALTKVSRQRLKWIIILAILLFAVVVWFIWDLTHPELGLIRLKQMGYIGFLG